MCMEVGACVLVFPICFYLSIAFVSSNLTQSTQIKMQIRWCPCRDSDTHTFNTSRNPFIDAHSFKAVWDTDQSKTGTQNYRDWEKCMAKVNRAHTVLRFKKCTNTQLK